MEGNNLLSCGINELNEIKESILELRGNQANNITQLEKEDNLEKSMKSLEKEIAEEIQATIRKRRAEIDDTFDQQLGKTKERIKKIKERRSRRKNKKMSERIAAETAPLRSENNSLHLEAGTVAKQKGMPGFCNTKLYFSLYFPSCFTDILLIAVVLAAILLLIPCGIYFLLLAEEKVIYLILTYVITVIFFGGIYLILGNGTKEKYSAELRQIRNLRSNIRANKKKIAVMKHNIKKDRDESSYDLQTYDEELTKLEKEEDDILLQKKGALETFDNTTRQVITAEIQGHHEEKLSVLREEYEKAVSEVKKTEEMIKVLTLKIGSEYEPFIGKDLMTLERLESLTNIILAGNAVSISEAIAFYRQNINKTPQE